VKIDYTNIFVMKAWGLMALGEALGPAPRWRADGYRRFRRVDGDRPAKHGIGEYGAVVYYGIDLDSLALIARHRGRAETRAKAERAIRHLWTRSGGELVGAGRPDGRDQRADVRLPFWQRLHRGAHVDGGLAAGAAGVGRCGLARRCADRNLTTFRDAVMWRPAPEWTEAIRAEVPRRCGADSGASERSIAPCNWIGRHVVLGVVGRVAAAAMNARGGEPRRTSPAVPQLTMFMEGRGDPYGLKKRRRREGAAFSAVYCDRAAGPEVLQVLSRRSAQDRSAQQGGGFGLFCDARFTVPTAAEVWIGERQVQPGVTVPAGRCGVRAAGRRGARAAGVVGDDDRRASAGVDAVCGG